MFRRTTSGSARSLGEGTPLSIVVLPVLFEGEVSAVIELARFRHFTDVHLAFLDQLTQGIGIVLNTIAATMRTEQLLKQSQALAEQLQKTNAELQEKAHLLAEQKTEVETKNREVEQAKEALEEKAEQLVAHLQVQERIPGQHEPRAAHAAEQPADSGADAGGERGEEPDLRSRSSSRRPFTPPEPTCWR